MQATRTSISPFTIVSTENNSTNSGIKFTVITNYNAQSEEICYTFTVPEMEYAAHFLIRQAV